MIHKKPVELGVADVSLDGLFFKLRDIELVKGDYDWQIEQQFTASYVLMVMMDGEAELMLDDYDCRMRKDVVYVCPPDQTYGVAAKTPDGLEMFFLKFDVFEGPEDGGEHVQYMKEDSLFRLKNEIRISPAGQLSSMCDTIYSHWESQDGLDRFRSQLDFQELLYCILKNSRLLPEESRTALECAKEYMDCYYNENLTIEQLARIAKISPKYFVDVFKKTYGVSAIDYLTELRIDRAKQFMAQSNAKLRDIAHQVGYNDEFYFSRKFKKEVGMTPTVYMKSRRRKIAAYRSSNIGQLLALKIIPYAAPLHPKWTAYYYKMHRADISVHLSAYRQNQHWESNIETLLHARPDIVISMDQFDVGEKERLDKVSNIFYVSRAEKDWREHLQLTAEFLGESGEAEHWLKSYDRKVKDARERLKQKVKDETFLVVRIFKQNCYVHSNRSMAEVFYHDLQLAPAYPFNQFVYNQQVTIEQLAEFDADHLLLMVCQEPETLAYWQTLRHSMLWQELKAVRSNRVYFISSDPWFEYSAFAHDRIVDESLKLFHGYCPK